MVKKRKAPLGLAQKLEMKSKKAKIENPFDRRFIREKHKVLNRKSKGNEGGLAAGRPGLSRSKALEKRKQTLLKEFKSKDKSNVFMDKRIGERDKTMTQDEKMVARFALAEKSRRSKKHSLFQLGDEEDDILTHSGKALSEIEKFEDPRSDDEDDKEGNKHLDAKYVEEAHFGGFMTRTDIEYAEGKSNTRKDWIENIISESKKRKADKQKDQEETEELTKNLDDQWKSVMPSLRGSGQIYTKQEEKEEPFSDEKAKKGESSSSYDTLLRELGFEKGKKEAKDKLKTEEEIIKEEKEKLEKLEKQRINRMNGVDDDEDMNMEENEDSDEKESDEDSNDEEEEDEDNSDLESESEEEQQQQQKDTIKKDKIKKKVEAEEQKEISKIPYTFPIPNSYEEFEAFFEDRNPSEHKIVMERLIKCNHPQFGNNNKEKLQNVFEFMLQYVNDCAMEVDEEAKDKLETINCLTSFLYELAQFSPQHSAQAVRSVLLEKFDEFSKNSKKCAPLETLIFLKITCLLFPTSDYRHPVATPAIHLMSYILSSSKFNTRKALTSGLFVAALLTESLQMSKRFCPEVITFLVGIVYISFSKCGQVVPYVPPFKVVGRECELLSDKLGKKTKPDKIKISELTSEKEIDCKFASSCLFSSLKLIDNLMELWKEKEILRESFSFLEKFLPALNWKKIHPDIGQVCESIKSRLAEVPSSKEAIPTTQKVKPKVLKLYDPEIENDFDPFTKKHAGSKEKLEMSKLLHKNKREKKGARKDIRADTAFLANQKAKEARAKDQERIRKTREILSGLGNQEGEVRKMQGKKKRMKN